MKAGNDRVTKRELIKAALDALAPLDDEAMRWALKRAIVQTAQTVGFAHRLDRSSGRAKLSGELEALAADARRLRERMGELEIAAAFFFAFEGYKDREDLAESRAAIDDLMKGWDDLPRVLHALEVCAPLAVDKLDLKGRRGSVGPWAGHRLTAKALLAAHGRVIFESARRSRMDQIASIMAQALRSKGPKHVFTALDRFLRPGRKDPDLHLFLCLLWELATGERDVMEWEAALRTSGYGAKIDNRNVRAWLETHSSGNDLSTKIRDWQLARFLLKHPEAATSGFHSSKKG